MKTLVQRQPSCKPAALSVAVRGLGHPESDVQVAAIDCLARGKVETAAIEESLSFRELLSPIARPRFEELLATVSGKPAAASADDEPPSYEDVETEPSLEFDESRERISKIPLARREQWKLDESLAACDAGRLPPPYDLNSAHVVLAGLAEIASIRDVDELIDLVGEAVEQTGSPMDIERILDGLSRFGMERPPEFEARSAAIRQRLLQMANPRRAGGMIGEESLLLAQFHCKSLIELLSTWLELDPELGREQEVVQEQTQQDWMDSIRMQLVSLFAGDPAQSETLATALEKLERIGPEAYANISGPTIPVYEVLNLRAKQVRMRLQHRKPPMPLLAFPTHEHGWIDPRVFVNRLKQFEGSGEEPDQGDFLIGLLRLAPDGRDEALRETTTIAEPWGRITRYALGDAVEPTKADRGWKHAWLAAGRSRSPRGFLQELEPLDLPQAANAMQPAQFRVHYDQVPNDLTTRRYQHYTQSAPFVTVEPEGQTSFTPAEYPVLVITHRLAAKNNYLHSFGLSSWGEAWLASHWPSNSDPFLAGGIQFLLQGIDSTASSWHASATLIAPLLHPELAWSETALRTIWISLFSRDHDARAVASDALIEGRLAKRTGPPAVTVCGGHQQNCQTRQATAATGGLSSQRQTPCSAERGIVRAPDPGQIITPVAGLAKSSVAPARPFRPFEASAAPATPSVAYSIAINWGPGTLATISAISSSVRCCCDVVNIRRRCFFPS